MALSTRICDELHGRDQMSLSSAFLPKPLCPLWVSVRASVPAGPQASRPSQCHRRNRAVLAMASANISFNWDLVNS